MLEILMEKVKEQLLNTIKVEDITDIENNIDNIVTSMMEGLKGGLSEVRRVE